MAQEMPSSGLQQVNYGGDPTPQPKDAKQLHVDLEGGAQQQQQHDPDAGQPKTIGDALETAAAKGADKPLEMKDVRAIQSAEARATGAPSGVLGGPTQYAQALYESGEQHTLGEALEDAKSYLPADKVVTARDAARIQQAEQRNDPMGRVDPAGVGSAVQEAAQYNISQGVVPPGGPAPPTAFAVRGAAPGT